MAKFKDTNEGEITKVIVILGLTIFFVARKYEKPKTTQDV